MASPKRVIWDASAWIALILDEQIALPGGGTKHRGQMCQTVLREARRGALEIWTPALALVETAAQLDVRKLQAEKVRAFFDHDYVFVVALDVEIADRARECILQKNNKSLPWLRPADATYVATAAVSNVDEIHAFDGPLSKLSGLYKTAAGGLITIKEPELGADSTPLLKAAGGVSH